MYKKRKKKKFRNVHEAQERVERELAEMEGQAPIELPDAETQKEIAQKIKQSQAKYEQLEQKEQATKAARHKRKQESKTAAAEHEKAEKQPHQEAPSKTTKDQEEEPATNKTYGEHEPPPIYVPMHRRSKEERNRSRSSHDKLLPAGAKPLDYITQFPTVIKRFFVELREPVPTLDKLLFFLVYIVSYFVTVLAIVLHYKYVKPNEILTVDVGRQTIQITVKKEDIPELKRTLGPNWLEKLGRRHINP